MEFGISESYVRFTTCSLFVGLIVGSSFWGLASDTIGRRPAFNMTLFLCGAFGLAAGGGPNWVGYVHNCENFSYDLLCKISNDMQNLCFVRLLGLGSRRKYARGCSHLLGIPAFCIGEYPE